jgi:hypothetical protein
MTAGVQTLAPAAGYMRRSLHSRSWWQAPLIAAVLLVTAACGSRAGAASQPPPPPPPLLPAAALPGMSVTQKALTPIGLSHDAPIAGLADRIGGWGYQSGAQRVFVGRARVFSNVVSRALRFKDAAGARAYVNLVRTRVADFFGRGSKVQPLRSKGRSGYLIDAASCGCHRETPIYVAVLSRAGIVTWLYATGPGMRPPALRALLAKAP